MAELAASPLAPWPNAALPLMDFRRRFDLAPAGLRVVDAHGLLVFANPSGRFAAACAGARAAQAPARYEALALADGVGRSLMVSGWLMPQSRAGSHEGMICAAGHARGREARTGGAGVLRAVDDGRSGVLEADRARIIEPFERGDNGTALSGSGLGLNLTRRRADLPGATLACESEVGQGTTFTLRLPSAATANKAQP